MPYGSDFALDFVPDVVNGRLQWNSYNPFQTLIKLNKKANIIAPIGSLLEDTASLEAIISGC